MTLNVLLWILMIVMIGTSGVLFVMTCIDFRREVRASRRVRSHLDPAIRGEIEQTMEWWDGEFRKLSGEPEPRKQYLNGAEPLVLGEDWRRAISDHVEALRVARVADISAPTTAELNLCQEHEYVEDRSFANQYVRIACINCDWEMEDW